MRSFFKTVLACFIAIMAAGFVGFIFVVLRITLDESISDNPTEAPFSASLLNGSGYVRRLALLDVISAIDAAAEDPRIEAIYLNINGYPSMGPASLGELRDALDGFRSSGKPLVSYADSYTQSAYYISSATSNGEVWPRARCFSKACSTNSAYARR